MADVEGPRLARAHHNGDNYKGGFRGVFLEYGGQYRDQLPARGCCASASERSELPKRCCSRVPVCCSAVWPRSERRARSARAGRTLLEAMGGLLACVVFQRAGV